MDKARSKINVKDDKIVDLMGKIEETDEMKLKLLSGLDKQEPEDVLYPAELNAHLIEQLKIMTSENNGLRKCVFTKEEEIKELNKTIRELNQRIRDIISGTGPAISSKSAGVISSKITELCKQNRHLIAEIESYKTKNSLLERKIYKLDLINKENEKLESCLCKDEANDPNPDELKELNNKLCTVNKKLYESKNRNLELKNDILVATKILQQELGDKFTSIKELQNDLAGWKGRAQQIMLLQSKISELEEKLNGRQKDSSETKRKDQSQIIREIELRRKKEIDQAIKDLNTTREENIELKKKLEGTRCRIRNLECDVTTIRQKMQTFVEKSNHDDLLINEQRSQIKNLELHYQEILKENTTKMNKMNNEIIEYQKSIQNTDAKIEALRQQASEKATKIEELRAQLLRYEECSLQSVFFTPMKTATDNEIKRLSELVVSLNKRLDFERNKWEELDKSHRKGKEKKRRLEKKIISLEEEIKSFKDFKKGSKTSRIGLFKELSVQNNGTPITKKHSSITAATDKPSETSSETPQTHEEYVTLDKEDLKYKLELSEERLKIMEDKLKMVEEEKQDDYNNLTEMIQTSKQLFNEALIVLKRDKCQCS